MDSGIVTMIPDSTSMDSGFHNQQPGFWITIMVGFRIPKPWIPDYLTWGDLLSNYQAKNLSISF